MRPRRSHREAVFLFLLGRNQLGRENWREGQREDDRPPDRERIRLRHRSEDDAPDTPVIVKRGMNATPMMSVENVIGVATSRALCWMRSVIVPFP